MAPSKANIKDMAWKWRCQLSSIGQRKDRTLSDFPSGASSLATEAGAASAADSAAPTTTLTIGGVAAIKTLYESKNSNESYIDWQDYPPRQTSAKVAKAHDRVAIKVYKVKDTDKPVISGRFALKFHRIDIQNPLLIAALEPILKKEGVHLDVNETAIFKEPFRPLFFRFGDIVAKWKSLADGNQAKDFVLLLLKLLDEIFAEVRAKRRHLGDSGLVSFNHAWTFFARDSVVISHASNCSLLSKVVDTEYVKKTSSSLVLRIRVKVLRFNGEAFEWERQELEIAQFTGNRPMTELRHYPLEFHPDARDVEAKMTARGLRVLDYQGLSYVLYTGIGIYQEGQKMEKHNVNGRILIDVVGYKKHHLAQGTRPEQDPEIERNVVAGTGRKADLSFMHGVPVQTLATVGRNRFAQELVAEMGRMASANAAPVEKPSPEKRLGEAEQKANREAMLAKPADLKFISPLIEGYALKNKKWMSFYVDDIRPMEYNDQAYDHLVYDEQQKDLVLSFVEHHGTTNVEVEDVIMGKGNGLIILLSGPPGTGKTLTAEAVADRTHRPLFYLQAEDLGMVAASLGANLKKVFEMATEWNAVVLLDEADVFMAQRHPQDIVRNELVSIFLRELEYFQGIIFLTTNLYDTIDSAFRSRVSLHLLFRSLSSEARLSVWQKFLDRLPKAALAEPGAEEWADEAADGAADGGGFDNEDLEELAAWNLNGREIKTAVKMVKLWCDQKGYEITLARLENAIKVTSPHAIKLTRASDTDLYD